jgi:predicted nucleic acid-binding protein
MSVESARPLFVDTSAFFARADESDANHERAVRYFDAIRDGDLPYRPLYTSQAVCSELATLLRQKIGHEHAVRVLTTIREAESITVLPIDKQTFARGAGQFAADDDQTISFVIVH